MYLETNIFYVYSNYTPFLILYMGLKSWKTKSSLLKKLMHMNKISWRTFLRYFIFFLKIYTYYLIFD